MCPQLMAPNGDSFIRKGKRPVSMCEFIPDFSNQVQLAASNYANMTE